MTLKNKLQILGDIVLCKRKAKKSKHDSYYEPALYKVKKVNLHNITLVKDDGTEFTIAQSHIKRAISSDNAEPEPDDEEKNAENDDENVQDEVDADGDTELPRAEEPPRRSTRSRKAPEALSAYVLNIAESSGSMSNILAIIEADLSTRAERYGYDWDDYIMSG